MRLTAGGHHRRMKWQYGVLPIITATGWLGSRLNLRGTVDRLVIESPDRRHPVETRRSKRTREALTAPDDVRGGYTAAPGPSLKACDGAAARLWGQQRDDNQRISQSREQRNRRAERHYRRRKADRGHEHRADRLAGIVAETLAGALDVGQVELRHERAHWARTSSGSQHWAGSRGAGDRCHRPARIDRRTP